MASIQRPHATVLAGAGEWGRDGGRPHPYPPPVTTIAWRMHHGAEIALLRELHRATDDERVAPAE